MVANLLIPPKFRAFDSNGNPLSGGLLYSYAAGTTTPLATYTTQDGTTPNANPVVLDANGEANVWTAPGVDYKFELRNSLGVVQWTVDNIPSEAEADVVVDSASATEPGGRLSLTSGTPVTTSDVSGATTIYYVPYKHNKVPLYDGSEWSVNTISTELSQATSDVTKSPVATVAGGIYDLFIWDDSGTLRLSRGPAWTSSSARGTGAGTTELQRVDGRLLNKVPISNGPSAQRGLYVGTIYVDTGASNQVNDTAAKRHVWNNYNRVLRSMAKLETTDTWTYNSTSYRQANGASSNQLDLVVGVSEDAVNVRLNAHCFVVPGDSSSIVGGVAGIGLDSVSATVAAGRTYLNSSTSGQAGCDIPVAYSGLPGIGRHYFSWMEKCLSAFTHRWLGDNGADLTYGLTGSLMG